MRVLIISANRGFASISGAAYIAGAALGAAHTVEVFDCLWADDIPGELKACISRFQPDVVGISIRFVQAVLRGLNPAEEPSHRDLRPGVRGIVDVVKAATTAPIVLGGPGFNYYGREWLEYLDLDYGLRGEAEVTFPLYLERLAGEGDIHSVPGCIYRQNGHFAQCPRLLYSDLDATAYPAYHLFDAQRYLAESGIAPAIHAKRGCEVDCNYCPHASLEGRRYRLKSPRRVADEIEYVGQTTGIRSVYLSDNLFNHPLRHAAAICRELVARRLDVEWGGEFTPEGITGDFAQLLREAGCVSVDLCAESGSPWVLDRMNRGYGPDEISAAVHSLHGAGVPFSIDLLIGGPGESPDTVAETFELIDSLPPPNNLYVTIGISLWTPHQRILADARRDGQLREDDDLFSGAYYLSPELPPGFVLDLVNSLKSRDNCAFWVNKAHTSQPHRELTVPPG